MAGLIERAAGHWSRREFLRQTFWSAGALGLAACGDGSAPAGRTSNPAPRASRFAGIGPLGEPDANGLRLPAGFSSRVIAVTGEPPVLASLTPWHVFPDGGATYPTPDGGWVYVSNSEVPGGFGGAGALRFGPDGAPVDHYRILGQTRTNCAGGKTPWQTWLSCEEVADGLVYECDPFQAGNGTPHPALGLFAHEAVAVDPAARMLYLTEDDGDGRFYRFVPDATDWPAGAARPQLSAGRLQVLRLSDLAPGPVPDDFDLQRPRSVVWDDVLSPELAQSEARAAAGAAAPGSRFRGGEGLWHCQGLIYFSTKSDNRIWCYDHAAQTLEAIYDFSRATPENAILSGVDNLTISDLGDVLVAEDGGDMQICVVLPDRRVIPLLQATDRQAGSELQSEITGPAFSPDGKRLYFSAQRSGRNGLGGLGITFEVTLPFSACPGGCP